MVYLMPAHYDDAVEERSIISKCGYPLCSETLKNVSKQQFKISTKRNEVLDITERKKFTSNQCFKCSTYLRQQINSTPLWLRTDKDNTLEIKFLNEDVDYANGRVDLNGAGIPCVIKSTLNIAEDDTEPKLEKEKISAAEPKKKEIVKPKRKLPPKTKSNFDFNEMTNLINAWWTSNSKNYVLGISPEENSNTDQPSLSQNTEIDKPKIDDDLRESAAKINAFLNGETDISLDKLEIKEKDVTDSQTTYLPPSNDKKDQVTLRRKVLHDNLKRG